MASRSLRKGKSLSANDMAKLVAAKQIALPEAERCKRQNIETLLNKDSETVHYLPALAAAMGTTVEVLAAGRWAADPSAAEPVNIEPGPDIRGKGKYPLISFVQAGDWTSLCDNFHPGDAESYEVTHHNLGECGFVLRVKGDSMKAPGERYSFPPGMLLFVNPDKDPVAGQFVIVRREREQEATFKKLTMVDGELFLEAINPDWPRRYLKLEDGDHFCGVVVDASFGNLP